MQRKTKKIYDALMITIDIILLIFMILSVVLKNDSIYALYWIIVSAMLLIQVYYVHKWDKIGELNTDKHISSSIRNSFNGLTTGTIVISGLLYLLVFGLEMINESIKNNPYVIIITGVMLTVSLMCNFLAVMTANKDSKELAQKTFNYKK